MLVRSVRVNIIPPRYFTGVSVAHRGSSCAATGCPIAEQRPERMELRRAGQVDGWGSHCGDGEDGGEAPPKWKVWSRKGSGFGREGGMDVVQRRRRG